MCFDLHLRWASASFHLHHLRWACDMRALDVQTAANTLNAQQHTLRFSFEKKSRELKHVVNRSQQAGRSPRGWGITGSLPET